MKRFWFSNDDGDNIADDHIGNLRGAKIKAQKYANETQEDVYINLDEDIVEVVWPN